MMESFFTIGITHYLAVASLLFILGCIGIVFNRQNIITLLMSIELALLGININFVAFSVYFHDLSGQVMSIFIFTVAAAEAAIGLAILITLYRRHRSVDPDSSIATLKG